MPPRRKAAAPGGEDDTGAGSSGTGDVASKRPLYDVLGIASTASALEIQRAYRLQARRVHPDKNPGDERAKEAFQQLQAAYEVLSDPIRREQYDQFGSDDSAADDSAASTVRNIVRSWFRPLTAEDIAEFERTYRGSDMERDDIAEFVQRRRGDISLLLEYVLLL